MMITSARPRPQLVVATPHEPMGPVSTPSGDQFVFADGTSQWPGLMRELYKVDPDGQNLTKLTDRPELSWQPAVAPDGQKVAYVVEKDGHADLHVMNLDGTGDTNLTQTNTGFWEPQWSPDGQSIVTTARLDSGNLGLVKVAADGSSMEKLTTLGDSRAARFTPDGSRIAFISNRPHGWDELCSIKPDGTDMQVHSDDVMALEPPTLSPDGHAVFSAVNRQSDIDLYSVKLDGSEPQKQLEFSGMALSPTFSPDGRMLAYLAPSDGSSTLQVFEAEANGANASALTEGEAFHLSPTYLPDGKSLLYVADYDGQSQLYKLDRS